jgi:hypothetical protein
MTPVVSIRFHSSVSSAAIAGRDRTRSQPKSMHIGELTKDENPGAQRRNLLSAC